MGLFDRLLNRDDPTRDWATVEGPPPAIGRLTLAPDAPQFGTPLESARVLGRPDQFLWQSRKHGNCELLYARKGCSLEYETGQLVGISYHLAPGSCAHPHLRPAAPRAPNGVELRPDMDIERVAALFGSPDERDEETLIYKHPQTTSILTFAEDGGLERWEVIRNE